MIDLVTRTLRLESKALSGHAWKLLRWPARLAASRRAAAQLAGMTDYELKDIGLLRSDISDAVRPRWRSESVASTPSPSSNRRLRAISGLDTTAMAGEAEARRERAPLRGLRTITRRARRA